MCSAGRFAGGIIVACELGMPTPVKQCMDKVMLQNSPFKDWPVFCITLPCIVVSYSVMHRTLVKGNLVLRPHPGDEAMLKYTSNKRWKVFHILSLS